MLEYFYGGCLRCDSDGRNLCQARTIRNSLAAPRFFWHFTKQGGAPLWPGIPDGYLAVESAGRQPSVTQKTLAGITDTWAIW